MRRLPSQRIVAVGKRSDAVINEAIGTAPNDNIAALQQNTAGSVAAAIAAEQENCRQSERNRNDRRAQVALVLVTVQRQPGPGFVQIYQTRVRLEARVPRGSRGTRSKTPKRFRYCRPGGTGHWVDLLVAIAFAVRYPAGAAAISHPDRHAEPARRHHVAKRRDRSDAVHLCNQPSIHIAGEPAQHHRCCAEPLDSSRRLEAAQQIAQCSITRGEFRATPRCPGARRRARN